VINSCPKPALNSEARSHMLRQIRMRLQTLRGRLASIRAEQSVTRQSLRPVQEAKQAVECEIDQLLADRKRLRIDRPRWLDITLSKRLERLRTLALAPVLDRGELHAAFLALFSKVIIDWERNRLNFHWKHGGESSVLVATKPLRDIENPRPPGKKRYYPGQRAPMLPSAVQ
jgi:hypothetical protein